MYVLRLVGTDFYLARKGCESKTFPENRVYCVTDDLNKALPLGNETTARTRARQWKSDMISSAKLFRAAMHTPANVELCPAKISLDGVPEPV